MDLLILGLTFIIGAIAGYLIFLMRFKKYSLDSVLKEEAFKGNEVDIIINNDGVRIKKDESGQLLFQKFIVKSKTEETNESE